MMRFLLELTFFSLLLLVFALAKNETKEQPSTRVPKTLNPPMKIDALEGENITFACQVDHLGEFALLWKKNAGGTQQVLLVEKQRITHDSRVSVLDDYSFQILDVSRHDSGQYLCVISSNPPVELVHTLNVKYPPSITVEPSSGLVIVPKGHTKVIKCHVDGNPLPNITWQSEKKLQLSNNSVVTGDTITFDPVDPLHSGVYKCIAENELGTDTGVITLKVLSGPPEIHVPKPWVHAGLDTTKEINCIVYTESPVNVTWFKDDMQLSNSGDHLRIVSNNNTYSIVLRKLTEEDMGNYTCVARNSGGETSAIIEISGLASAVKFKSDPSSYKPTSYALMWEVESYSLVIDYLLQFRERKENSTNDWEEVTIPAERQPGLIQTQTYDITGLKENTFYDMSIQVRNKFGWNKPTTFVFSTKQKVEPAKPTEKIQEVNEDPQPEPYPEHVSSGTDENRATPTTEPPERARVLGLLTVIILSFFFW